MSFQRSNPNQAPPVVLTIAGFDPSSGAGITADLQVFAAHGLFGISAITALTVQSTTGVASVEPVAPSTVRCTLEHLAADFDLAGIKIGMLGSGAIVHEVAGFLKDWLGAADRSRVPVVLDPVLRSSSGAQLLESEGVAALQEELTSYITWMTPNHTEIEVLAGGGIAGAVDVQEAMDVFARRHPHVHIVVTGGDNAGEPMDLWRSPDGEIEEVRGQRVETSSTHGTGCAYSSALLSLLVLRFPPRDAVKGAKAYVEGALRGAPGLGRGSGPLNLLWPMRPQS